jgi:hypothetical protein
MRIEKSESWPEQDFSWWAVNQEYTVTLHQMVLFILFSLVSLLMDKKYSDGVSIDIELYAPYFASGNDNHYAQNI